MFIYVLDHLQGTRETHQGGAVRPQILGSRCFATKIRAFCKLPATAKYMLCKWHSEQQMPELSLSCVSASTILTRMLCGHKNGSRRRSIRHWNIIPASAFGLATSGCWHLAPTMTSGDKQDGSLLLAFTPSAGPCHGCAVTLQTTTQAPMVQLASVRKATQVTDLVKHCAAVVTGAWGRREARLRWRHTALGVLRRAGDKRMQIRHCPGRGLVKDPIRQEHTLEKEHLEVHR